MTSLMTENRKPSAPADNIAAVAGRGTIYITAAKIWFVVSGAAIHFVLPRFLTPEQFGMYEVAVYVVSIVNAVIITATYQSVSKRISEDEANAGSIKAKALKLQVLLGGGASLGFFLLAPVIAGYLNDLRLVPYLRLASLITLAYSFYAVFTGYFNGRRKFLAQASLDMSYSTLKLGFIVLLVWLGYGVGGGIGGFALAAASVLALSAVVAGKSKQENPVSARQLLGFQAYVLLFTLAINLLQRIDLIMVKALSSADASVASENAGYYGAAINVANVTHQAIVSATFVIFPLISQSTFASDRERTRLYIANTLRYTLMVMALIATLFSANAGRVLSLIYKPEYQAGTAALSVVAYGMLLFGVLYVVTTIISASGRPAISLIVAAITLGLSVALNSMLIPLYGLVGAAIATTASMFVGVAAAASYLHFKFGALMSPASALRIVTCAAIIYAASRVVGTSSKLLTLIQLITLSIAYLVALVATRELGRDDLRLVAQVFRG
jgi:stage V sporulation protein B